MSLARLVQDFYSFSDSEGGAQAVLDLVTLERDWRRQEWTPRGASTPKIGDPAEIKTAGDFIEFLQILGQSKYFSGHNRAEFKDNDMSVSLKSYFRLAQRMGMIDEMTYTLEEKPTYMAVFGSSESQYHARLQALKTDLLRGIIPTSKIIYALGTDARGLGAGALESEENQRRL